MTRRRWIADEHSGDSAALTGANAAHLARVLRARVGQEFDVALGDRVRRASVSSVSEDRVEFALGDEVAASQAVPITLYLAVFKFDRFEWAVEKCTELGVARMVPVIARRTERHLASAAGKRVERWRRIAREAAQQSRRAAVPLIGDPAPLKKAVADASGLRIVLAETEKRKMLRDFAEEQGMTLAIGPEGGWTEDELAIFDAAGWQRASLGETILRAETAAMAAVAIVAIG
jgi:16S rRNA (uracil1498-N3)-methyltransferase